MKKIILFFSICIFIQISIAQTPTKSVEICRITQKPVIDGTISPGEWDDLSLLDNFIQFAPYNGNPETEKSIARIGYDNEALYILTYFFDSKPEDITKIYSSRDAIKKGENDLLYVVISPYQDNNYAFNFILTSTGTQQDEKCLITGSDAAWNAVWESKTSITDKGWLTEIKIPFSALRFPAKEIQDWKFNIWRRQNRLDEWTCWSFADNAIGAFYSHNGLLKGFKNLEPPLRLSFTPYVSTYLEKSANGNKSTSFNAGMDIKYGINESYTLDAILIPDFGQVQSDEEVLNLTPYEIKYDENRQFFTEGVELFNKGNIFYSRRIGNTPVGFSSVKNQLGENEVIDDNPNTTKLLNAIKISGKNSSGLAIGVLNAMTSSSEAEIKNSVTGETREIETQSFTNYNMLVLEKQLSPNSFLAFANTNVKRKDFVANVFATDFKIADDKNVYAITGRGAISYKDDNNKDKTGFSAKIDAGKKGGQFQYQYSLEVISDKYDPNDMGYLWRGNEVINQLNFNYNFYRPFSAFLNMYNSLTFTYKRNYSPDMFTSFNIRLSTLATTKNKLFFQYYLDLSPSEEHDLYDLRVPGRKLVKGKNYSTGIYAYTDSRKPLMFTFNLHTKQSFDFDPKYEYYRFSVEPTFKFSGRSEFSFATEYQYKTGYLGTVGLSGNNLFVGDRNVNTIINSLKMKYKFNNDISLYLKIRHYWSEVEYQKFYLLISDGYTTNTNYTGNHDVNYNNFTVDFKFRWNFMPGSEISVVWKNAIAGRNNNLEHGYFRNLSDILEADQANSVSVKMLYYLDYLSL